MQKEIQKKLDAQLEKGNKPKTLVRVLEVSDAPLLSADILERDKRTEDLVEINFRDQSAKIVETSKAPKLTHKVLAKIGKPVKSVEFFHDEIDVSVNVRDGRPFSLDIAEDQLRIDNGERIDAIGQKDTPEAKEKHDTLFREMNIVIKQLTVAKMITDPQLSFNGVGDGTPIENQSMVLLNSLMDAYAVVNFPAEDQIYQAEVLRGVPGEAAILLKQGFELYPLGSLGKKTADLSESEIQQLEASNLAQHRVLVSSMLPELNLSYNGHGQKNAFPVEELCGRFLQTLHEAYRVVNIPEARRDALSRFQGLGGNYGNRTETVPESVADDGGEVSPSA